MAQIAPGLGMASVQLLAGIYLLHTNIWLSSWNRLSWSCLMVFEIKGSPFLSFSDFLVKSHVNKHAKNDANKVFFAVRSPGSIIFFNFKYVLNSSFILSLHFPFPVSHTEGHFYSA